MTDNHPNKLPSRRIVPFSLSSIPLPFQESHDIVNPIGPATHPIITPTQRGYGSTLLKSTQNSTKSQNNPKNSSNDENILHVNEVFALSFSDSKLKFHEHGHTTDINYSSQYDELSTNQPVIVEIEDTKNLHGKSAMGQIHHINDQRSPLYTFQQKRNPSPFFTITKQIHIKTIIPLQINTLSRWSPRPSNSLSYTDYIYVIYYNDIDTTVGDTMNTIGDEINHKELHYDVILFHPISGVLPIHLNIPLYTLLQRAYMIIDAPNLSYHLKSMTEMYKVIQILNQQPSFLSSYPNLETNLNTTPFTSSSSVISSSVNNPTNSTSSLQISQQQPSLHSTSHQISQGLLNRSYISLIVTLDITHEQVLIQFPIDFNPQTTTVTYTYNSPPLPLSSSSSHSSFSSPHDDTIDYSNKFISFVQKIDQPKHFYQQIDSPLYHSFLTEYSTLNSSSSPLNTTLILNTSSSSISSMDFDINIKSNSISSENASNDDVTPHPINDNKINVITSPIPLTDSEHGETITIDHFSSQYRQSRLLNATIQYIRTTPFLVTLSIEHQLHQASLPTSTLSYSSASSSSSSSLSSSLSASSQPQIQPQLQTSSLSQPQQNPINNTTPPQLVLSLTSFQYGLLLQTPIPLISLFCQEGADEFGNFDLQSVTSSTSGQNGLKKNHPGQNGQNDQNGQTSTTGTPILNPSQTSLHSASKPPLKMFPVQQFGVYLPDVAAITALQCIKILPNVDSPHAGVLFSLDLPSVYLKSYQNQPYYNYMLNSWTILAQWTHLPTFFAPTLTTTIHSLSQLLHISPQSLVIKHLPHGEFYLDVADEYVLNGNTSANEKSKKKREKNEKNIATNTLSTTDSLDEFTTITPVMHLNPSEQSFLQLNHYQAIQHQFGHKIQHHDEKNEKMSIIAADVTFDHNLSFQSSQSSSETSEVDSQLTINDDMTSKVSGIEQNDTKTAQKSKKNEPTQLPSLSGHLSPSQVFLHQQSDLPKAIASIAHPTLSYFKHPNSPKLESTSPVSSKSNARSEQLQNDITSLLPSSSHMPTNFKHMIRFTISMNKTWLSHTNRDRNVIYDVQQATLWAYFISLFTNPSINFLPYNIPTQQHIIDHPSIPSTMPMSTPISADHISHDNDDHFQKVSSTLPSLHFDPTDQSNQINTFTGHMGTIMDDTVHTSSKFTKSTPKSVKFVQNDSKMTQNMSNNLPYVQNSANMPMLNHNTQYDSTLPSQHGSSSQSPQQLLSPLELLIHSTMQLDTKQSIKTTTQHHNQQVQTTFLHSRISLQWYQHIYTSTTGVSIYCADSKYKYTYQSILTQFINLISVLIRRQLHPRLISNMVLWYGMMSPGDMSRVFEIINDYYSPYDAILNHAYNSFPSHDLQICRESAFAITSTLGLDKNSFTHGQMLHLELVPIQKQLIPILTLPFLPYNIFISFLITTSNNLQSKLSFALSYIIYQTYTYTQEHHVICKKLSRLLRQLIENPQLMSDTNSSHLLTTTNPSNSFQPISTSNMDTNTAHQQPQTTKVKSTPTTNPPFPGSQSSTKSTPQQSTFEFTRDNILYQLTTLYTLSTTHDNNFHIFLETLQFIHTNTSSGRDLQYLLTSHSRNHLPRDSKGFRGVGALSFQLLSSLSLLLSKLCKQITIHQLMMKGIIKGLDSSNHYVLLKKVGIHPSFFGSLHQNPPFTATTTLTNNTITVKDALYANIIYDEVVGDLTGVNASSNSSHTNSTASQPSQTTPSRQQNANTESNAAFIDSPTFVQTLMRQYPTLFNISNGVRTVTHNYSAQIWGMYSQQYYLPMILATNDHSLPSHTNHSHDISTELDIPSLMGVNNGYNYMSTYGTTALYPYYSTFDPLYQKTLQKLHLKSLDKQSDPSNNFSDHNSNQYGIHQSHNGRNSRNGEKNSKHDSQGGQSDIGFHTMRRSTGSADKTLHPHATSDHSDDENQQETSTTSQNHFNDQNVPQSHSDESTSFGDDSSDEYDSLYYQDGHKKHKKHKKSAHIDSTMTENDHSYDLSDEYVSEDTSDSNYSPNNENFASDTEIDQNHNPNTSFPSDTHSGRQNIKGLHSADSNSNINLKNGQKRMKNSSKSTQRSFSPYNTSHEYPQELSHLNHTNIYAYPDFEAYPAQFPPLFCLEELLIGYLSKYQDQSTYLSNNLQHYQSFYEKNAHQYHAQRNNIVQKSSKQQQQQQQQQQHLSENDPNSIFFVHPPSQHNYRQSSMSHTRYSIKSNPNHTQYNQLPPQTINFLNKYPDIPTLCREHLKLPHVDHENDAFFNTNQDIYMIIVICWYFPFLSLNDILHIYQEKVTSRSTSIFSSSFSSNNGQNEQGHVSTGPKLEGKDVQSLQTIPRSNLSTNLITILYYTTQCDYLSIFIHNLVKIDANSAHNGPHGAKIGQTGQNAPKPDVAQVVNYVISLYNTTLTTIKSYIREYNKRNIDFIPDLVELNTQTMHKGGAQIGHTKTYVKHLKNIKNRSNSLTTPSHNSSSCYNTSDTPISLILSNNNLNEDLFRLNKRYSLSTSNYYQPTLPIVLNTINTISNQYLVLLHTIFPTTLSSGTEKMTNKIGTSLSQLLPPSSPPESTSASYFSTLKSQYSTNLLHYSSLAPYLQIYTLPQITQLKAILSTHTTLTCSHLSSVSQTAIRTTNSIPSVTTSPIASSSSKNPIESGSQNGQKYHKMCYLCNTSSILLPLYSNDLHSVFSIVKNYSLAIPTPTKALSVTHLHNYDTIQRIFTVIYSYFIAKPHLYTQLISSYPQLASPSGSTTFIHPLKHSKWIHSFWNPILHHQPLKLLTPQSNAPNNAHELGIHEQNDIPNELTIGSSVVKQLFINTILSLSTHSSQLSTQDMTQSSVSSQIGLETNTINCKLNLDQYITSLSNWIGTITVQQQHIVHTDSYTSNRIQTRRDSIRRSLISAQFGSPQRASHFSSHLYPSSPLNATSSNNSIHTNSNYGSTISPSHPQQNRPRRTSGNQSHSLQHPHVHHRNSFDRTHSFDLNNDFVGEKDNNTFISSHVISSRRNSLLYNVNSDASYLTMTPSLKRTTIGQHLTPTNVPNTTHHLRTHPLSINSSFYLTQQPVRTHTDQNDVEMGQMYDNTNPQDVQHAFFSSLSSTNTTSDFLNVSSTQIALETTFFDYHVDSFPLNLDIGSDFEGDYDTDSAQYLIPESVHPQTLHTISKQSNTTQHDAALMNTTLPFTTPRKTFQKSGQNAHNIYQQGLGVSKGPKYQHVCVKFASTTPLRVGKYTPSDNMDLVNFYALRSYQNIPNNTHNDSNIHHNGQINQHMAQYGQVGSKMTEFVPFSRLDALMIWLLAIKDTNYNEYSLSPQQTIKKIITINKLFFSFLVDSLKQLSLVQFSHTPTIIHDYISNINDAAELQGPLYELCPKADQNDQNGHKLSNLTPFKSNHSFNSTPFKLSQSTMKLFSKKDNNSFLITPSKTALNPFYSKPLNALLPENINTNAMDGTDMIMSRNTGGATIVSNNSGKHTASITSFTPSKKPLSSISQTPIRSTAMKKLTSNTNFGRIDTLQDKTIGCPKTPMSLHKRPFSKTQLRQGVLSSMSLDDDDQMQNNTQPESVNLLVGFASKNNYYNRFTPSKHNKMGPNVQNLDQNTTTNALLFSPQAISTAIISKKQTSNRYMNDLSLYYLSYNLFSPPMAAKVNEFLLFSQLQTQYHLDNDKNQGKLTQINANALQTDRSNQNNEHTAKIFQIGPNYKEIEILDNLLIQKALISSHFEQISTLLCAFNIKSSNIDTIVQEACGINAKYDTYRRVRDLKRSSVRQSLSNTINAASNAMNDDTNTAVTEGMNAHEQSTHKGGINDKFRQTLFKKVTHIPRKSVHELSILYTAQVINTFTYTPLQFCRNTLLMGEMMKNDEKIDTHDHNDPKVYYTAHFDPSLTTTSNFIPIFFTQREHLLGQNISNADISSVSTPIGFTPITTIYPSSFSNTNPQLYLRLNLSKNFTMDLLFNPIVDQLKSNLKVLNLPLFATHLLIPKEPPQVSKWCCYITDTFTEFDRDITVLASTSASGSGSYMNQNNVHGVHYVPTVSSDDQNTPMEGQYGANRLFGSSHCLTCPNHPLSSLNMNELAPMGTHDDLMHDSVTNEQDISTQNASVIPPIVKKTIPLQTSRTKSSVLCPTEHHYHHNKPSNHQYSYIQFKLPKNSLLASQAIYEQYSTSPVPVGYTGLDTASPNDSLSISNRTSAEIQFDSTGKPLKPLKSLLRIPRQHVFQQRYLSPTPSIVPLFNQNGTVLNHTGNQTTPNAGIYASTGLQNGGSGSLASPSTPSYKIRDISTSNMNDNTNNNELLTFTLDERTSSSLHPFPQQQQQQQQKHLQNQLSQLQHQTRSSSNKKITFAPTQTEQAVGGIVTYDVPLRRDYLLTEPIQNTLHHLENTSDNDQNVQNIQNNQSNDTPIDDNSTSIFNLDFNTSPTAPLLDEFSTESYSSPSETVYSLPVVTNVGLFPSQSHKPLRVDTPIRSQHREASSHDSPSNIAQQDEFIGSFNLDDSALDSPISKTAQNNPKSTSTLQTPMSLDDDIFDTTTTIDPNQIAPILTSKQQKYVEELLQVANDQAIDASFDLYMPNNINIDENIPSAPYLDTMGDLSDSTSESTSEVLESTHNVVSTDGLGDNDMNGFDLDLTQQDMSQDDNLSTISSIIDPREESGDLFKPLHAQFHPPTPIRKRFRSKGAPASPVSMNSKIALKNDTAQNNTMLASTDLINDSTHTTIPLIAPPVNTNPTRPTTRPQITTPSYFSRFKSLMTNSAQHDPQNDQDTQDNQQLPPVTPVLEQNTVQQDSLQSQQHPQKPRNSLFSWLTGNNTTSAHTQQDSEVNTPIKTNKTTNRQLTPFKHIQNVGVFSFDSTESDYDNDSDNENYNVFGFTPPNNSQNVLTTPIVNKSKQTTRPILTLPQNGLKTTQTVPQNDLSNFEDPFLTSPSSPSTKTPQTISIGSQTPFKSSRASVSSIMSGFDEDFSDIEPNTLQKHDSIFSHDKQLDLNHTLASTHQDIDETSEFGLNIDNIEHSITSPFDFLKNYQHDNENISVDPNVDQNEEYIDENGHTRRRTLLPSAFFKPIARNLLPLTSQDNNMDDNHDDDIDHVNGTDALDMPNDYPDHTDHNFVLNTQYLFDNDNSSDDDNQSVHVVDNTPSKRQSLTVSLSTPKSYQTSQNQSHGAISLKFIDSPRVVQYKRPLPMNKITDQVSISFTPQQVANMGDIEDVASLTLTPRAQSLNPQKIDLHQNTTSIGFISSSPRSTSIYMTDTAVIVDDTSNDDHKDGNYQDNMSTSHSIAPSTKSTTSVVFSGILNWLAGTTQPIDGQNVENKQNDFNNQYSEIIQPPIIHPVSIQDDQHISLTQSGKRPTTVKKGKKIIIKKGKDKNVDNTQNIPLEIDYDELNQRIEPHFDDKQKQSPLPSRSSFSFLNFWASSKSSDNKDANDNREQDSEMADDLHDNTNESDDNNTNMTSYLPSPSHRITTTTITTVEVETINCDDKNFENFGTDEDKDFLSTPKKTKFSHIVTDNDEDWIDANMPLLAPPTSFQPPSMLQFIEQNEQNEQNDDDDDASVFTPKRKQISLLVDIPPTTPRNNSTSPFIFHAKTPRKHFTRIIDSVYFDVSEAVMSPKQITPPPSSTISSPNKSSPAQMNDVDNEDDQEELEPQRVRKAAVKALKATKSTLSKSIETEEDDHSEQEHDKPILEPKTKASKTSKMTKVITPRVGTSRSTRSASHHAMTESEVDEEEPTLAPKRTARSKKTAHMDTASEIDTEIDNPIIPTPTSLRPTRTTRSTSRQPTAALEDPIIISRTTRSTRSRRNQIQQDDMTTQSEVSQNETESDHTIANFTATEDESDADDVRSDKIVSRRGRGRTATKTTTTSTTTRRRKPTAAAIEPDVDTIIEESEAEEKDQDHTISHKPLPSIIFNHENDQNDQDAGDHQPLVTPKRRGRPPKATTTSTAAPPTRSTRSRSKVETTTASEVEENDISSEEEEHAPKRPTRRGVGASKAAQITSDNSEIEEAAPKKRTTSRTVRQNDNIVTDGDESATETTLRRSTRLRK